MTKSNPTLLLFNEFLSGLGLSRVPGYVRNLTSIDDIRREAAPSVDAFFRVAIRKCDALCIIERLHVAMNYLSQLGDRFHHTGEYRAAMTIMSMYRDRVRELPDGFLNKDLAVDRANDVYSKMLLTNFLKNLSLSTRIVRLNPGTLMKEVNNPVFDDDFVGNELTLTVGKGVDSIKNQGSAACIVAGSESAREALRLLNRTAYDSPHCHVANTILALLRKDIKDSTHTGFPERKEALEKLRTMQKVVAKKAPAARVNVA